VSKFSDLIASLRVVKSERAAVEAKLAAARRELQSLRTASMCKADTIAAIDAYLDGCRAHFDENILRVMRQHNRDGIESFNSIGGGLPLLRNVTNGVYDDRLAVAVLAPQMKAQIRESLKAWECPGTLPLAKRKARCAELEEEIAKLDGELREIIDAADQARAVL
jgi:hypothetical protein